MRHRQQANLWKHCVSVFFTACLSRSGNFYRPWLVPDLPEDICSTLPMSILYRLALEPIAQRPDIHRLHFLPGQSSIQLSQTSGVLVVFFAILHQHLSFIKCRQQNLHSEYLCWELIVPDPNLQGKYNYLGFSNVHILSVLWYSTNICLQPKEYLVKE